MQAPEALATARLLLRRPTHNDALAIFESYASVIEVTRYVGWPRHRSLGDTADFIAFSDSEWMQHAGGPYLIVSKETNRIIGSTGFSFETAYRAATGYVLSRESWGNGYAVEAMSAIVAQSAKLGIERLFTICHYDHQRSARVSEKSGFAFEGTLRKFCVFPNFDDPRPTDVLCYSRVF